MWGGRLRVSKGCVLGEYCVVESEGKKRGEREKSKSDRGSCSCFAGRLSIKEF